MDVGASLEFDDRGFDFHRCRASTIGRRPLRFAKSEDSIGRISSRETIA